MRLFKDSKIKAAKKAARKSGKNLKTYLLQEFNHFLVVNEEEFPIFLPFLDGTNTRVIAIYLPENSNEKKDLQHARAMVEGKSYQHKTVRYLIKTKGIYFDVANKYFKTNPTVSKLYTSIENGQ